MSLSVDDILARPNALRISRELQERLDEEQRRRREFEENMVEGTKAEFINGEIIIPSPVRTRHLRTVRRLSTILSSWSAITQTAEIFIEKCHLHFDRNSYEPDIAVYRRDVANSLTPDQMYFPAPDLIVEVLSPSTERIDRGVKFEDYSLNGVPEYWTVDPDASDVEVYTNINGSYVGLPQEHDRLQSKVFPTLQTNKAALFDDEALKRQISEYFSKESP